MPLEAWLPLVGAFVLGAIIGSFLNVCIYRMPLEKSLLWPGSHCGHCWQRIRWYDNVPLLSYWWLRGRCRVCGAPYSLRYFGVELLTALCFAGLFYLEFVANVHQFDAQTLGPQRFFLGRMVLFGYHALLVCFLLVATFCDFDHHIIPLSLTLTGTVVGLVGAVLFPWPWPYTPAEAAVRVVPGQGWAMAEIKAGVFPWPVWGPLPAWLEPGGNWQTGLATGMAGLLVGTLLLRVVRFLFSAGLGAEALGLGDADLMMMAGCFLGWQPVVVAFFLSAIPGLVFAVVLTLYRWFDARKKSVILMKAFQKEGKLALRVVGRSVTLDHLGDTLEDLVKNHQKSDLLLDSAELAELVDRVIEGIRDDAKRAGIDTVRIPNREKPEGLLGIVIHSCLRFWRRWFPPPSRFTIPVKASLKDGHPALEVNSQPTALDQLAAVLSGLAQTKDKPEVLIDAADLEEGVARIVGAIWDKAKRAGVQHVRTRHREVPFGPALAVGLVLTMVGWRWISPAVQFFFFSPMLILVVAGVCGAALLGSSFFFRIMRMVRQ